MKVIDLLPVLNAARDASDECSSVAFYRGSEFLASYGMFEIDCEAMTVMDLLNSEVGFILPNRKGQIRVFIKE